MVIGCENPPSPKPTITVTVQETNEECTITVLYQGHDGGWTQKTFSTLEEVEEYRKQLEFAVIKFKEAEEKIKHAQRITSDTQE